MRSDSFQRYFFSKYIILWSNREAYKKRQLNWNLFSFRFEDVVYAKISKINTLSNVLETSKNSKTFAVTAATRTIRSPFSSEDTVYMFSGWT